MDGGLGVAAVPDRGSQSQDSSCNAGADPSEGILECCMLCEHC